MTTAVYPGSFDPMTNGHTSILKSGLTVFDKVVVAILQNASKDPLFSIEERSDMIRASIPEVTDEPERVEIDSFDGLLVDYCRSRGASTILRGLRAVADFEYELQMANMNRHLNASVETVFIMADDAYFYVSSKIIKEAARLGGDVRQLVPKPVAERLRVKLGA